MKKYEFTIPKWALTYIENGDRSSLNNKEMREINNFLKDIGKKYGRGHWDWPEDSYFSRSNDINNMGSDVYDAKYLVIQ